MATNSSSPSRRSIVVGIVILGAAVAGGLAIQYGPSRAADLLMGGAIGVLYVVIPVAVVTALLLGFFRFNAWRQSGP